MATYIPVAKYGCGRIRTPSRRASTAPSRSLCSWLLVVLWSRERGSVDCDSNHGTCFQSLVPLGRPRSRNSSVCHITSVLAHLSLCPQTNPTLELVTLFGLIRPPKSIATPSPFGLGILFPHQDSHNSKPARRSDRDHRLSNMTTFSDTSFVVQSPDVTYTDDEMVSKYTYQVLHCTHVS